MKRAMGLLFLLVIASGCASVSELPEVNPYGRTLIETQPPGGRIEINGQYVGPAPVRVDMPVYYNGRAVSAIVINAYPFAAGQFVQTKVFEYGDFVPTHMFFDLNLPVPPQPLLVQVNQPQRSHHRDEDDEEKFHRQKNLAVQNLLKTPPVVVAHQTQTQQQSYMGRSQNTNYQNSNTQNNHYQHFQNSQTPGTQTPSFSNPARTEDPSRTRDNDTRSTSNPTTVQTPATQPASTISRTPVTYPPTTQTPVVQPVSRTPVITHEDLTIRNEVPKVSTPTERPQIQQVAAPVISKPEPRTRDEVRKSPISAQPTPHVEARASQSRVPQAPSSSTATFSATSTMTSTATQTNTGTSIS